MTGGWGRQGDDRHRSRDGGRGRRTSRHRAPAPRTDAELLAATGHEPEAFGELYRRHVDAITGYVASRVRDPHSTAELVAETFASALAGRDGFEPERGPVRAWLFGIARNQVSHHWRRQRSARSARERLGIDTRLEPGEAEDLARVIDRIDADGLLDLVDELPSRQREAVRRRVIDDADHDEIAAAMGVSRGNARVLVHRGLKRLASLRESRDDDGGRG